MARTGVSIRGVRIQIPNRANYDEHQDWRHQCSWVLPGWSKPLRLSRHGGQCMGVDEQYLYERYPYEPNDGREDPQAHGARTIRGGAWRGSNTGVRCARRMSDAPHYGNGNFGFRIVSTGS